MRIGASSDDANLVEQLNMLMAAKHRFPLTAAELKARPFPVRLFDNAARLALPYLWTFHDCGLSPTADRSENQRVDNAKRY